MILAYFFLFAVQMACVVMAVNMAKSKKLSVPTWAAFTVIAGPFGPLALLQLPLVSIETPAALRVEADGRLGLFTSTSQSM